MAWEPAGLGVHNELHQGSSRDAVCQRVVHPHDERSLSVLQTFHHVEIPKRLGAVHQVGQNPAGERLQFRLPARGVHLGAEDVPANIEVRVVLPRGIPDVKWRIDGDLAIAREQVQLRVDRLHKLFEGNRPVEDTDGRDV